MSSFEPFGLLVSKRLSQLAKLGDLVTMELAKGELWDQYINALPVDERASHNCNNCRHFINNYGGLAVVKDGVLHTLWEGINADAPYAAVPAALDAYVRTKAISNVFLSTEAKLGVKSNPQHLTTGTVITWHHFHGELPRDVVVNLARSDEKSVEAIAGKLRAQRDVFRRSLETITADALKDVLALVNAPRKEQIYRIGEFKAAVDAFAPLHAEYHKLKTNTEREFFVWENYRKSYKIRNTEIGNLLVNLSEGMEYEGAINQYLSIMDPAKKNRPSSLVSPAAIKAAEAEVERRGLTAALNRRHARSTDIPLEHLIYVHRSAPTANVFQAMHDDAPVNLQQIARAPEITLEKFLADVVPSATNLDFLLSSEHTFVSLIAPVDPDAPQLLRWKHPISWTYANNMTDVIAEKVKKAGGSVTGELRVSLEWFNRDDLDLEVYPPRGGLIYFAHKKHSGGELDVDMNAGGRMSDEPVENITFDNATQMKEGLYIVHVNPYAIRAHTQVGFNIEITCRGVVYNLSHPEALREHHKEVARFHYSRERGIYDFKSKLDQTIGGRQMNGVVVNKFARVTMITRSPNYWAPDASGNEHLFLILEGARTEEPLRPFFNEYLLPDLREHRKVFEMLGARMMIHPADEQLTGVGFSLTQRNKFAVRANGKIYNVTT